ncbi:ankyrin repeat-containing protein BDA1 [Eucalyptus grandis]|uniref:ankyrin repeat-containing protein BDA1 n=1 Tax=Eucalyptus grandis TaxID=71139 RepID=UPI00192E8BCD|nr:ankyrin repeat-containing protein BDA1 [Eucalyptus grandis]
MPKLAEKVNAGGFSPLHIAAARGNVEVARELLTVGPHLCFVKGRESRIPLHYAAIKGELDVMNLLLSASHESIEETTARQETVLHLAVKNNRFEAVVRLVEHLKLHKKEKVINWKDHKGDTALHLAAAGKNFEVISLLLCGHAVKSDVVEVNPLNDSGSTPLDVLTLSRRGAGDREIREILVRAGALRGSGRSNSRASRPVLVDDDDIEGGNGHQSDGDPGPNAQSSSRSKGDILNALLVVATLIANATYQSVLQPPSIVEKDKVEIIGRQLIGGSQNSTSTEDISYSAGLVYILFLGGNSFGFLVSVQMIIYLTKKFPLKWPLRLSIIAMVLTYFCFTLSLLITSTDGKATATVLNVLPLMIAVFLLLIQNWLAIVLDFFLHQLFRMKIFGDLYKF